MRPRKYRFLPIWVAAYTLSIVSLSAFADRYGMYEDPECVVDGNCGSSDDAFTGLLLIGGASLAVFILKAFSPKLTFLALECVVAYVAFGLLGDKYGIFYNILAFLGLQFWVLVLWGLSDAMAGKD